MATKIAKKNSDGTLDVMDAPTKLLYKTLFKAAHDRVQALFENDPDGISIRVTHGLQASMNTAQVSRTGDRFVKGAIQNIDENPDFQPTKARGLKGRPALYQRLAKDPTFSEGKDKAWEALVSGHFEIQPEDRKDLVAAEQAREVNENINDLFTSQVKLEWCTGAFDVGFAVWEYVDFTDGFIDHLAYVRPDTVREWIVDEANRLLTIHCEDADGEFDLPAEHAWLYSHRRLGNNYDGIPQLREVAVYVEMKWMLLRLMGLSAEVHGLGLKTIEKDPEINQAGGSEDLVQALENMSAEDIPIIELGPGRRLNWHAPGHGMPDFVGLLEFLDNQITKKTSTSGTHLTYNDHASRALAEVKDTETSKTGRHYGLLMADAIHSGPVRRILENRHPGNARRLKTVFHLSQSTSDPERFKRLLVYVQGGMLKWGPEDEAALRESEGLPMASGDTVSGSGEDAASLLKQAMAKPANEVQSS